MRIGCNLPYSDRLLPEPTWGLLTRLDPQEIRVTSFVGLSTLDQLLAAWPTALYHVRPRTGNSNRGTWPSDLLDFQNWEGERTLRDTLDAITSHGIIARVSLGNEADIEFARAPVDDWPNIREATTFYADWFHRQRNAILDTYREGVEIAVTSLSQGAPERFKTWKARLQDEGCYTVAAFVDEHLYSDGRPLDDPDWLGRWQAWSDLGLPIDVTELNDNGAFATSDPNERAAHYAEMVSTLAAVPAIRSVSLFTLPGAPDDSTKPHWWLLTPEIVDAVAAFADAAPAPPAPVEPEPEPIAMTEYEQFCRSEAARRGIDPDTAVTVANSEGSLTEPARVGDFSGPPWYSGKSWWAFQLHYGGIGYEDWGGSAGMGNSFTALTGWAPGDPAAWRDAMRYALDRVRTSGWGAWYGAAARGIHGFDGVDSSVPWSGTPADEWDYLQQPSSTTAIAYDPSTPPERQVSDWACSIRSATWLLKSLGVPTDAGQMQTEMVPDYVTPAAGLLLGSGVGLAEVIQRHLPAGLVALPLGGVTWDELVEMAGHGPIAMGSGSLYHWIAVADVIDAETLSAPNPAPNYHGLGDRLTHQQFDTWAPWNAVWVEVTTAEHQEEGGDDLSAAERAELGTLRNLTGNAYHDDGVVPAAIDRALTASAPASKDTKARLLKKLSDLRQEATAVRGFLRENNPDKVA